MQKVFKVKVGIYARESDKDTEKAPSIEKQIEVGKQWIRENKHELVIIYADNGFSGGDWNRKDWKQSIKDGKRHLFQILWVWNQDRLARDTEQFLWYYRNMTEVKVRIWEGTSNNWINMSSLGDRVKHQSLAQAAEIFRLITSEKVKKSYETKMKKGESWGRPKLKLDIQKILLLRKAGLGYRKIAEELGTYKTKKGKIKNYNYQTIRRLLLNPPIKNTI